MRMEEEAFYNISMYLYQRTILKYSQIARNGTESKITYIESHSNIDIEWGHPMGLFGECL